MSTILLTASNTFIIGPIAKLFGVIMNFIYDKMHVTNVGWDIVLLAFVVYMLTLPLTVKQQKFSKLSAVMNPEIQAVQKKYQGKKDNESMMRMQEETKAVQEKYGVKTSAGCLPTLIQLPILWALYQVIYRVPAYLKPIRAIYENSGIIKAVQQIPIDKMTDLAKIGNIKVTEGMTALTDNQVVDILWKCQSKNWEQLKELGAGISGFADKTAATLEQLKPHITFCGISIAESPMNMFLASWNNGHNIGGCLVALLIPVLAALTQWINTKLMPQQPQSTNGENPQADQMANTMKSMNIMMPLMSLVFCFTLPSGIGIYWIIGAVYRSIQQVLINNLYLKKLDIDAEIEKNKAKYEAKKAKSGVYAPKNNIAEKTKGNYKNLQSINVDEEALHTSGKKTIEGSMASKANMVASFNAKNKKGGEPKDK